MLNLSPSGNLFQSHRKSVWSSQDFLKDERPRRYVGSEWNIEGMDLELSH